MVPCRLIVDCVWCYHSRVTHDATWKESLISFRLIKNIFCEGRPTVKQCHNNISQASYILNVMLRLIDSRNKGRKRNQLNNELHTQNVLSKDILYCMKRIWQMSRDVIPTSCFSMLCTSSSMRALQCLHEVLLPPVAPWNTQKHMFRMQSQLPYY